MFGYGPGQFTHYYLGHETLVNSGLVLPHSSILNYLIFSGVLGLLIIILLTLKILYNNQANFEVYILGGFFVFKYSQKRWLALFTEYNSFCICHTYL